MNPIIATVDTQISSYSSIGTINVLDDVTIDLTILTNGIVNAPWIEPEFQLIGVKADKNEVRQLDGFNVTSLENRTLAIKLKNEMLTYPGMLKLQLITKDSGRTSTTVFYLYVGQSLEHDIVSHRDVKVLDDLEAYVEKANHNLEIYEQRMDIRDEQFNNLNDLMNQAEAKRDQAELTRQQIFDVNEASRTRTFNNQMNNQETSFNDVQIERANEFERDQTERADDFIQAQNNREQAFNESQSANQSTFNSNEKKRQDEFNANQASNQKIFNDSESARARTFEVAESERCENEKTRKEDESKRVSDEVKRVEAENKRQQKMQEFEDIANQIASDLQEQVTRVDEFVTANELKLLEEDARIDYMGNQQKSIRKVNEANVDYAVKSAIGEFNYLDYEGQHITATNSIEGHARSAILKGNTLVNVFPSVNDDRFLIENSTTLERLEDGFLRVNAPHNGRWQIATNTIPIKPSTNYLLITEVKNNTVDGRITLANVTGFTTNNLTKVDIGFNGVLKQIITTLDVLEDYIFQGWLDSGTTGFVDIRNVLIEYQEGMENWDIPYFEGMQSVRMPVLMTTGKNLCDGVREYNGVNDVYGANFIKVEEGKRYGIYQEDKNFLRIDGYSNNKEFVTSITGGNVGLITIPSGVKYIKWKYPLYGEPYNENSKIMIALSDRKLTLSDYEPHKSNILTVNEDVTLRKVGDVQDTLDCLTGEVVERIGEVVLDGSQPLVEIGTLDNTYGVRYVFTTDVKTGRSLICDKLTPVVSAWSTFTTTDSEVIAIYTNAIAFRINKNKLSDANVESVVEYLKSNPIKVQYPLAQESIKTVDLSDNVVYSYNGTTHYSCSSEEGSLVPTLSVKVPTDVQATIAQQRNTIVALEAENEALKDGLIEANQYREDGDMDLLSNQWDIDFRLFEIEMVLDVPMAVAYKIAKETDIMSRFLQAKTLILGGRYERSKMEYQLKRYLEAGQLTQEEYDELISLMDAREMLE